MKQIKKITKKIEEIAYKNVDGFDHTGLCYKTIFEIMKDAILKAVDETANFEIEYVDQVNLFEFQYNIVKESDEKIYPCVDLMVDFQDEKTKDHYLFRVRFSPFNCSFNKWNNPEKCYAICDKNLTHCWRIVLKGFYGERWVEAYKNYCLDIKCLKESKIATRAEKCYLKLEKEFDDEINLI